MRHKETLLQESDLIPEEEKKTNTISLTKKKCCDCEVIGLQFDSLFNYSIINKKKKLNVHCKTGAIKKR